MKVQVSEHSVPFVITYRKVLRRPKLVKTRQFVGVIQMMKNAMVRAITAVEELAFETETKVEDPGQSVAVHWAVDVEDPWDTTTGREKNLVAYRMLGDKPSSGMHFEIFSMPPKEEEATEEGAPEATPAEQPTEQPVVEMTPEQWTHASRTQRIREATLPTSNNRVRGLNGVGSLTAPVVDPAYGPRPVKTLDQEVAEGSDEESDDLDRAGGLGEDD